MGDGTIEIALSSNEAWTLVLLGRTGNGKSSTGNSILKRPKAFATKASSSGVTSTCELKRTVLDGRTINVIDTPGLFSSSGSEYIIKEIAKCITLAKDGIHAILLVLSIRTRFSDEEEAAVEKLQDLFGSKIYDYMIVVFTGGDELEENEETLDDYLGHECPQSLKRILKLCGNRKVLFDNKTKDAHKKDEQVKELLFLVSTVMKKNGGQPYTNELFIGLKKGREKQFDERDLNRLADMVEARLRGTIDRLGQQLAEEKNKRQKQELMSLQKQMELDNQIHRLGADLERARRDNEQLRNNRPQSRTISLTLPPCPFL